jgi:hypothetical protein
MNSNIHRTSFNEGAVARFCGIIFHIRRSINNDRRVAGTWAAGELHVGLMIYSDDRRAHELRKPDAPGAEKPGCRRITLLLEPAKTPDTSA